MALKVILLQVQRIGGTPNTALHDLAHAKPRSREFELELLRDLRPFACDS